jgi:hypothetical protein
MTFRNNDSFIDSVQAMVIGQLKVVGEKNTTWEKEQLFASVTILLTSLS